MGKVTITHEFDYYEEQTELKNLINARGAQSVLFDLDMTLRDKIKYSEEEWLTDDVVNFLERLRQMIHESNVLDEYT